MKTIPLSLALSVIVLTAASIMAAERVYLSALFPIPYKLAVDGEMAMVIEPSPVRRTQQATR